MAEKKPSEVFLALWYSRISGQVISRDEFFALAETWAEIRTMEVKRDSAQRVLERLAARGPMPSQSGEAGQLSQRGSQESTPEGVQKVHPDRVEKVHGDEPERIPDRSDGPPFSPAEPDSFPKGDAKDGVVQNGPDPAKSAAAAAGMANRKRNDMARLEALRARGVSMQTVAESAAGLTLNDVLDFMDRKPIQFPKLVALEKAMKKLEAGA